MKVKRSLIPSLCLTTGHTQNDKSFHKGETISVSSCITLCLSLSLSLFLSFSLSSSISRCVCVLCKWSCVLLPLSHLFQIMNWGEKSPEAFVPQIHFCAPQTRFDSTEYLKFLSFSYFHTHTHAYTHSHTHIPIDDLTLHTPTPKLSVVKDHIIPKEGNFLFRVWRKCE